MAQPLPGLTQTIRKNMKRIFILSFSLIRSDPRVMRQVRLLERNYRVTVCGFGPRPDADIEFIELESPRASLLQKATWAIKLLSRLFDSYYWNLPQVRNGFKAIRGRNFDLLIANDIAALPLALQLAGKAPVLVDAHEYSPREFEDKWLWRVLFGPYHHELCRRYLPRAAVMITVCQGIADEYARHYSVNPLVVHNAPVDQRLLPSPTIPGQIRLIHHGAAIPSRHLEAMIDVMKHLDKRFTLDFMLVETDAACMRDLRCRAAGDDRIRFIPAVPMADICRTINKYDVGIFLLPPVNFNYEHALPNKLFEFIQARLAVAIGPSPEMARIVQDYSLGVVADSFEPSALAESLEKLTDDSIAACKRAAGRAAKELSFEVGGRSLLHEIERLV
jgi:glycosyltransferase involved in cell wall biosynthesis